MLERHRSSPLIDCCSLKLVRALQQSFLTSSFGVLCYTNSTSASSEKFLLYLSPQSLWDFIQELSTWTRSPALEAQWKLSFHWSVLLHEASTRTSTIDLRARSRRPDEQCRINLCSRDPSPSIPFPRQLLPWHTCDETNSNSPAHTKSCHNSSSISFKGAAVGLSPHLSEYGYWSQELAR